jgi:hypothetical protein
MNLPTFFLPKHQSNTQRMGFAVFLIAMVAVIFLHNPIDGYQTEVSKDRYEEVISPKCTKHEVSQGRALQLKGRVPINQWHEMYSEPLPEGIETWPISKQVDWQMSTYLVPGNEIINRCVDIRTYSYDEALPFSEWRSKGPLVGWFGSVVHLLGALVAIAVAALIWLVILQPNQDHTASP